MMFWWKLWCGSGETYQAIHVLAETMDEAFRFARRDGVNYTNCQREYWVVVDDE